MPSERNYALDDLRLFVIFLVIVLHASISYMAYAPDWWYVLDRDRSLFFTGLVLLVDVPIMLVMFFLAGYFAYPSLAKRGPAAFLRDKLVRIGLPWAAGALLLAPPTAYMIYFSRNLPVSLWTFWRTDFWGKAFQQSVYWYLGVLLLLFTLTALLFAVNRRFATWQAKRVEPDWRLFGLFLALVTAASLLVGQVAPLDQWSHVYLFVFQPVRAPLYAAYFALGILARQQCWLTEQGYRPSLPGWLAASVATGVLYLECRLALSAALPPATARATAILFFNLFCFTALMAGLASFLRIRTDSGFWRGQARNSYGIYYLHPLFLYPLAWAMVPVSLSIYAKAVVVILGAYLLSWAGSALILTRLPGLRRMF